MRRTHLLVATATAVGLLAAPALGAVDRIVHGRSIGIISVGEERATIGGILGGDGVVIARTPDPQAPGNRNLDAVTVAYPSLSLVVRFPTDEASSGAFSVATRNARYGTAAGVGVGSPRARILAAFPRAVCTVSRCQVGPRAGDVRITRFSLSGGRAVRVTVFSAP